MASQEVKKIDLTFSSSEDESSVSSDDDDKPLKPVNNSINAVSNTSKKVLSNLNPVIKKKKKIKTETEGTSSSTELPTCSSKILNQNYEVDEMVGENSCLTSKKLPAEAVAVLKETLGKYRPLRRAPAERKRKEKEKQTQAKVKKSLNLSKNYAANYSSQNPIREFVQNWADRLNEQSKDFKIVEKVLQQENGSFYFAVEDETCLGYLFEFNKNGEKFVEIINFNTTLNTSVLCLGNSVKLKKQAAAGHFGEGLKVQLNTLVANGCICEMQTSNQIWTFGYERERNVEVLAMTSFKSQNNVEFTALRIFSANIPKYMKKRFLQPEKFLFLTPSYKKNMIATRPGKLRFEGAPCYRGIEMLLDEQFRGEIYVHGIFVRTFKAHLPFGINYIGPHEGFQDLKLGRDRSTIDLTPLVLEVFWAGMGAATKGARFKHLKQKFIELIYHHLDNRKSSMFSSVWDSNIYGSYKGGHLKTVANILANYFKEINPGCIPKERTRKKTNSLDLGLVKEKTVSHVLFQIFSQATNLPTVESILRDKKDEIMKLPNPKFTGNRLKLCEDIKQKVQLIVGKRMRLHVKLMPENMKSPVLKFTSPTCLVLDANYFTTKKAHQLLRGKKKCQAKVGQMCSCVSELFIWHTLDAICSNNEAKKLDALMKLGRNCLLKTSVKNGQTQEEEEEDFELYYPEFGGGNGGRKIIDLGDGNSNVSYKRKLGDQYQSDTQPNSKRRKRDPYSLNDLLNRYESHKGNDSVGTVAIESEQCNETCVEKHSYVKHNSIVFRYEMDGQTCSQNLLVAEKKKSIKLKKNVLNKMLEVVKQIHVLLTKVFDIYPARFCVYYDPNTTFEAFMGDCIFYNLATNFEDIDFLFETTCHELAHLEVHCHNEDFSNVMFRFGVKYKEKLDSVFPPN